MNFDEQQKVLRKVNQKDVNTSGWVGFSAGLIIASLIFLVVFIPMAEDNARAEESHCTAES